MIKLFEDLIRYNANDRGSRVGDCVKRSLSLAFDIPYNEVQKELNAITRDVNGTGRKIYDYHNAIVYSKFINRRGKKFEKADVIDEYNTPLKIFAENYPEGTYLILTGNPRNASGPQNHMVAVIDGDIYDSWDSTNQLVKWVCIVQGEKQNRKQSINIEDIYSELFRQGSDIIRDTVESSRFYKNNNVGYVIQTSTVSSAVNVGHMSWYITIKLLNGEYTKQYKITYAINPTHSAEQNIDDALTKLQAKAKQTVYNISQINNKLLSYTVDDDMDTHYRPKYEDERKVFNSLPMWVRKRLLSIYVNPDYYDERRKTYEITIYTLPGDPRADGEGDIIRIYAESMKELLDKLDMYKDGYKRDGYDY